LQPYNAPCRADARGFTLVELLVVVLILAILMAVALPLYLKAASNSERRVCRENMRSIANAEQSYYLSQIRTGMSSSPAGRPTATRSPTREARPSTTFSEST